MPNWIAKLAGKWFGSKIKLEDTPMDGTQKWYKSRTVWIGVVGVLVAGYSSAAASFGLPPIPEFVFGILSGMGIYTRVMATKTIE
jgi:hypothetical protein